MIDIGMIIAAGPPSVARAYALRTGEIPDGPVAFTAKEAHSLATQAACLAPEDIMNLVELSEPGTVEYLLGSTDAKVVECTLLSSAVTTEDAIRFLVGQESPESFPGALCLVAEQGSFDDIRRTNAASFMSVSRIGGLLQEGHTLGSLIEQLGDGVLEAIEEFRMGDYEPRRLVVAVLRAILEGDYPLPTQDRYYFILSDVLDIILEDPVLRKKYMPLVVTALIKWNHLAPVSGAPRYTPPTEEEFTNSSHGSYPGWLCTYWSNFQPFNAEELRTLIADGHIPLASTGYCVAATPEVVAVLGEARKKWGPLSGYTLWAEDPADLAELLRNHDPNVMPQEELVHSLRGQLRRLDGVSERALEALRKGWEQGLFPGDCPSAQVTLPNVTAEWADFVATCSPVLTARSLVAQAGNLATPKSSSNLARRILAGEFEKVDASVGAALLLSPERSPLWAYDGELMFLALSTPEGRKSLTWGKKTAYRVFSAEGGDKATTAFLDAWVDVFLGEPKTHQVSVIALADYGSPEAVRKYVRGLVENSSLENPALNTLLDSSPEAAATWAEITAEVLGEDFSKWWLLTSLSEGWTGTYRSLLNLAAGLTQS